MSVLLYAFLRYRRKMGLLFFQLFRKSHISYGHGLMTAACSIIMQAQDAGIN